MDRTKSTAPRRRLGSIPEAAEYAGVSQRTIRRRIADGSLPAYRVGPRLVRIDLADLDALARRIPAAGGTTPAA